MNPSLLTVRVANRQEAAQDIVVFDLVDPDGGNLPEFSPGAHIDVYLPDGFIRQYSLASDCHDRKHFRIAVLREAKSRGGSIAAYDKVRAGDRLQISAPRNRFKLAQAGRSLLFAGGIGVTPLLCMARELQASGASFDLHYSCRSRNRAAFLDEIQESALGAHAHYYFDDEPGQALDVPACLRGFDGQTQVYVCGPTGYMDSVVARAHESGMRDAQIHVERFALADTETDPAQPVQGDFAFQVKLASTGEIFDIPADETITSALDRQGVYIPVSCEEGICGTCLTGVVEGIPDHRDTYLTDEEHAANNEFTPCCSRSKKPLIVLDL